MITDAADFASIARELETAGDAEIARRVEEDPRISAAARAARERLVARIDRDLGPFDPRHLRALRDVPRERFVRARVTVGGRSVRVFRRRGRLAARVNLRGRPLSTVRVRVIARTSRGRIVRETRSYRLCAVRRGGG